MYSFWFAFCIVLKVNYLVLDVDIYFPCCNAGKCFFATQLQTPEFIPKLDQFKQKMRKANSVVNN